MQYQVLDMINRYIHDLASVLKLSLSLMSSRVIFMKFHVYATNQI